MKAFSFKLRKQQQLKYMNHMNDPLAALPKSFGKSLKSFNLTSNLIQGMPLQCKVCHSLLDKTSSLMWVWLEVEWA